MTRQTDLQTFIAGIDQSFPVAGQDNDSQTFRDNFRNIKTSLSSSTDWLNYLDTNTAKLNSVNDFQNNEIQNATFRNNAGKVSDHGTLAVIDASLHAINSQAGDFHTVVLGQYVTTATFYVSNWPDSGLYRNMRVSVTPTTSTTATIHFSDVNGGNIWTDSLSRTALPYVSTSTATIVWDVFSTNAGQDTYVKFIGSFLIDAAP